MGYDFKAGRLDTSVHPFTASCGGPGDVRITTHLVPGDPRKGLFATLHEGGHGLYEQGFKALDCGLLAIGASTAVHESQARLWENLVGRSLPFWRYWFPRLKKAFPDALRGVKCFEFYRFVNRVAPSFIRIEADEVTYALHIVLRFEIERDLVEGRIGVKDLSEVWNAKMKDYLGIVPTDHRSGVLQDVHWAAGYFGYFPCYALGNLYASQFYTAASRAMPDLEDRIAAGDLSALLDWLRKKIHRFGRIHTAPELVKRVTKKPLGIDDFMNYLEAKYGLIYKL
jgi:carboxypeptidase Taq